MLASLVDPMSFMSSERDHVSEGKVETQLNNSFTHKHTGGGGGGTNTYKHKRIIRYLKKKARIMLKFYSVFKDLT